MTLEKLREQRNTQIAQARAVAEKATAENRAMTPEENTAFDSAMAAADATKAQIDRMERLAGVEAEQAASRGRVTQPAAVETAAQAASVVTDVRERALDDPRRGFATAGQFVLAAHSAFTLHQTDDRLRLLAASGMNQAAGADGGFLVPPQFSTSIWDGMNSEGLNLLGYCDQYPVDGESLSLPANGETTRASTVYGGALAYWLGEAVQMTASTPKARQVKLEPKELGVLIYATDKLLRNTAAAEAYITRAASAALSYKLNDAIINGDGVGKPLGLLNSNSLVSITKETSQAATTIVSENVIKAYARLHASMVRGALWLHNQDTLPQLLTLTLDRGTSSVPMVTPAGGATGQPASTLWGLPLLPCEFCKSLGTKGDLVLANLKGYAVGVKRGVEGAVSMHLRFDYRETAFRWVVEIDGQPWLASALTPANGSNTLSTHVAINARA